MDTSHVFTPCLRTKALSRRQYKTRLYRFKSSSENVTQQQINGWCFLLTYRGGQHAPTKPDSETLHVMGDDLSFNRFGLKKKSAIASEKIRLANTALAEVKLESSLVDTLTLIKS